MQWFKRPHRDEAEEYFKQGLRYRDRKKKEFNFALAVEHFKEAIRLNPENSRYRGELARAYVAAPLLAVTRGLGGMKVRDCLPLAVDELKEALRLDPQYVEAYLVLGEAYMYLGEEQKAAEALQIVIQAPNISFFGDRLLKSYAKRELKYLEQGGSRQFQPDVAQEHIERAILYREEKKYRLAEMELVEALKVAPGWSWLYRTICELVD